MTSFSSNFTDQALPSTEAENWIQGQSPAALSLRRLERSEIARRILRGPEAPHADRRPGTVQAPREDVRRLRGEPVREAPRWRATAIPGDIMDAVIRRVAPGLILDLSSDDPKVICLLAGSAQSMSIDTPGEEPDITKAEIEENVASRLGDDVGTKVARRQVLGDPVEASRYEFGTESVYTFHSYDDAMDYGRGTMHIPMYGEYDIKPSIGRQPLSLTAVTKSGDILYDFRIWHESHQHEEEW
eukprot:CAMPEP_0181138582 /NCGR_PEP_ID=MMETSP1071-20121207/34324_1 /TAXON_ID=35127 /ORGANISM="Thalassiosira sp., Strain NH16" /LENGTH=242 /DNA_ID=CAMNT_0023225429 /DNA_START=137 /DNA_END=866 /DNA_ORIENTATION=+